MNLNEKELEMIRKMAGLFYSPKEIAIIVEAPPEEFEAEIKCGTCPIFLAYMKGYLEADIDMRQSIMQSALNGSSPAQTMLREIQRQSKISS